jgi:mono/diheme cytochrome c family protein
MPVVSLPDADLQQLVVYLSSLGAMPNSPNPRNASPTHPSAIPPAQMVTGSAQTADVTRAATEQINALPLTPEAQRGRAIFERNGCESCHGIGGLSGTVAAPGLAGTASILPAKTLEDLLRHHSKPMQRGGMPLTNMNSQDMNAVIAFIRSLPNTSQ